MQDHAYKHSAEIGDVEMLVLWAAKHPTEAQPNYGVYVFIHPFSITVY